MLHREMTQDHIAVATAQMARSAAVLEAALRQLARSDALTGAVMDGQDLEPGVSQ